MAAYVIVQFVNDIPNYLRYGIPPSLTPNIRDARKYAKPVSAKSAIGKLRHNLIINPLVMTVQEISE